MSLLRVTQLMLSGAILFLCFMWVIAGGYGGDTVQKAATDGQAMAGILLALLVLIGAAS